MRTIKELLELLLENQIHFSNGLCFWITSLHSYGKISNKEHQLLLFYITNSRPSKFSSWDTFKHRNKTYYWTKGNIEPRIEWIKKHIKLNS